MTFDTSYQRSRSEVGLSDLLAVLAILGPDREEDLVSIATSMGLSWIGRESVAKPEPIPELALQKNPMTTEFLINPVLPEQTVKTDFKPKRTKILLNPIAQETTVIESIFTDPMLSTVKELGPTDVTLHAQLPVYQPLLRPSWFRGIMRVILATLANSKNLDWTLIEKYIMKGRPLEKLPLKQRSTLKRGVLLFLDRSDSMQPFRRDEKEVIRQLERFLSPHQVQLWWLEVDRWRFLTHRLKWSSPPPQKLPMKTPILLITDFGGSGEPKGEKYSELEAWLPLIKLARNYQCPVRALIPMPESYWTDTILKMVPVALSWDWDTSVQTAVRRVGRLQ